MRGPELKQVLKLKGYCVIDTDNGQDAARQARQTHPDLLVVDIDVPLLYGLVAARQIVKHAQVGSMQVVIITHEDVLDPAPMLEVGATRNEYVTRLSMNHLSISWTTCCRYCRHGWRRPRERVLPDTV